MKRDMDLGRKILLELEGERYDGNPHIYELPTIENYSEAEVAYHVSLLQDAGLLLAREFADGALLIPYKLTWDSHEFLDAARNDTFWERAKAFILKRGGALTFEALKTVLPQIALNQLGL